MQKFRALPAALLREGTLITGGTPLGSLAGRIAAAVACVAVGALVVMFASPSLAAAGYIILLPAVGLATLIGGPLPGLIAALLAAVTFPLAAGAAPPPVETVLFATVALWDVGVISALLAASHASSAALARAEALNHDLQASEARFRDLLEAAPDAIVICGSDERIFLVNAEAERLFGRDRAEMVGQGVEILMPERFRARHGGRIAEMARLGGQRRMGDGDAMFGLRRDGSEFPIETNLSCLPGGSGALICAVIRDLTIRHQHQAAQTLLIRELNHRVKNTLASVQSIIGQTLRTAVDPRAFGEALTARIMALSHSHDVLTRNDWSGAMVADIVAEQLKPYERSGDGAFHLEGPPIRLRPNRAVALGMAVGELCTNAAKYGALSAGGRVDVAWSVDGGAEAPDLRLLWTESRGPAVRPPKRRGFGTRMIDRSISTGLHGTAQIDFRPSGVVCELTFPLLEREAEPEPA